MVDYLVGLRWIPVLLVVLPVSFLLEVVAWLRRTASLTRSFRHHQLQHDRNVARLIERLGQRRGRSLVCTARKPYSTVGIRNMDYKRARRFEVDLSAFRNVLAIDRKRMVARVEPLVTMAHITRLTVPLNLSLPVVPELDDLTIGGLVNSYGIEASSHVHGLFSDTVLSYEVVLADGTLVEARADNEYADLFYAIPWSQGTLGLVVAIEIKLIEVKEYVKLQYLPVCGTMNDIAVAYVSSFTETPAVDLRDLGDGHVHQCNEFKVPEFVETIITSPTEAVCMTGWYASKEEAERKGNCINRQGWWFKPWFYQHAQTCLKRGAFVEYIPTRDYYHRHTRSYFWECKLILPFADQAWFRFVRGYLQPPV